MKCSKKAFIHFIHVTQLHFSVLMCFCIHCFCINFPFNTLPFNFSFDVLIYSFIFKHTHLFLYLSLKHFSLYLFLPFFTTLYVFMHGCFILALAALHDVLLIVMCSGWCDGVLQMITFLKPNFDKRMERVVEWLFLTSRYFLLFYALSITDGVFLGRVCQDQKIPARKKGRTNTLCSPPDCVQSVKQM